MNAALLKKRFLELLPPPLPSDWEAEENIIHLIDLPEEKQDLVLAQVQAIWPVSNSLCYSYLSFAGKAVACLDDEQVAEWVSSVLDIYEKMGLKEAQSFMDDVEGQFLCRLRGETGVELDEVISRLQPYTQGIARYPVTLAGGADFYTDTANIYLPPRLATFKSERENFLLYKLMITAQLQLIRDKTLDFILHGGSDLAVNIREDYSSRPRQEYSLEEFWHMFPEPRLSEDIFTLVEALHISRRLASDFPGLWKDTAPLRDKLALRRDCDHSSSQSRLLEALVSYVMTGKHASADKRFSPLLTILETPTSSPSDSAKKTALIYTALNGTKETCLPIPALPYIGRPPFLGRPQSTHNLCQNNDF